MRLGARHVVGRIGARRQAEAFQQEGGLQTILAGVGHHRRAARRGAGQAVGEEALTERLAGHQPVAHDAQRLRRAAAHGLGLGADAADGQSAFQQAVGVVLVLDGQVEQHPFADQHLGQRREEPGAQAVGIQRRHHHQRRIALLGQLGQQVGLQQLGTAQVLQQTLAQLGGPARPAAHHQRRAQRAFQGAHPLGNGRRGEVQARGRLLEAAAFDHGPESLRLSRVQLHDRARIKKMFVYPKKP